MNSTFTKRFWAKVIISDGCWWWIGANNGAYGHLSCGGRKQGRLSAHRASWILHNGEIPLGLCVLHKCDNPLCVNPKHLFLGTQLDNAADRVKKGRDGDKKGKVRGEKNGNCLLTEQQIKEIRRRYSVGGIRQIDLAQEYGLSRSGICMIVTKRSWGHVWP